MQDPDKFYSPKKKRPSGHDISKGFGKDNGGAIPSNLLQISNSESNGQYFANCQSLGISQHPARFPAKLPEFFIKFLTEPNDLIVDIFAGSNTAGWVAENEERQWLSFDESIEYLAASSFRFVATTNKDVLTDIHRSILQGSSIDLSPYMTAQTLSLLFSLGGNQTRAVF